MGPEASGGPRRSIEISMSEVTARCSEMEAAEGGGSICRRIETNMLTAWDRGIVGRAGSEWDGLGRGATGWGEVRMVWMGRGGVRSDGVGMRWGTVGWGENEVGYGRMG